MWCGEIDSLAPFFFSNQKSPSCSTWSTTPHAPSLQSPPPPRTFGTRWSRGCCFCSGNSRDGCCRPPPELVKEQPRGLSAARSLGRLRWSRLTTRPRESDGVQQKRGLRAACNARADAGIACRVPCVCKCASGESNRQGVAAIRSMRRGKHHITMCSSPPRQQRCSNAAATGAALCMEGLRSTYIIPPIRALPPHRQVLRPSGAGPTSTSSRQGPRARRAACKGVQARINQPPSPQAGRSHH